MRAPSGAARAQHIKRTSLHLVRKVHSGFIKVGKNFVAVTGGGYSTELLQNNEWILGNFFGILYLLSISFHTNA